MHSPERYHLYLLNADGSPGRRFALFGLAKKATDWTKGEWGHDYGLSNFAAAPGGSWIATSGDLGLALWDNQGTAAREKWAHEWWKTGERTPLRLLALDDTLITFAANTITGLAAADGSTLWSIGGEGGFGGGVVSGDRRTAVIWSDADGGRVYVIRGGALVNTIPTAAGEVSVSADGSFLAVTFRNQLKAYDPARGLLWTYTGDDLLRRPRVSPDGTRVAVGNELGTLAVLWRDGTKLVTKDLKALPVSAWLPDGGLLVATWTGTVLRYTAALDERRRTRLTPSETDIRPKLLTPDPVPAVRRAGWGNATATQDLTPNLIRTTSALLDVRLVNPTRYVDLGKQNAVALLTDGRADAPANPWVSGSVIGAIRIQDGTGRSCCSPSTPSARRSDSRESPSPRTPPTPCRGCAMSNCSGGTPKPGSGRTARNSFPTRAPCTATPSRPCPPPVSGCAPPAAASGPWATSGSANSSSTAPWWATPTGTVLEGNALAVLFDDRDDDVHGIVEDSEAADIQIGGAAAGTRCLRLKKAVERYPTSRAPFGHAMHDWDFRIVENPSAPGECRYLQFAWNALSPATTGICVRLGPAKSAPIFSASIGDSHWSPQTSMVEKRFEGRVPADWEVVRVGLWKFTAGAVKVVDQLALRSNGDGALFDQIVLARTEAALPILPWPPST
ncbi:hypothetical protein QF035_000318 [Streptomyces umbrinus]|uniref:Uncharacterized protein n=1 Tax=Streptomyces umbrinus TaxID=67370 RepID=A0ABU0SJ72_9ACTN|nr:hypothetical protein [Streptomyces umbrinus]MDQ1022736.1 hypothetical protein [Streptomyces umbrinus]